MQLDGNKLKKSRLDKGWSQELLAKASGLSLRTIQRVEKNNTASTETLLSIASALAIAPDLLYPDEKSISANWSRKNTMQNLIAIIIFSVAVGSLFYQAAPLLTFVSAHLILYTFGFVASATILAFGVDGLQKSIQGLKYVFSQELCGGRPASFLAKIYESQIKFCYGGAVLVVSIGIASIHGLPQLYGTDRIHEGYSVLSLAIVYAALITEVILRPLKTKLETCDMSAE